MFSGSRGIPEPRSFDAVRQMVRGTGLPQKANTAPIRIYTRENHENHARRTKRAIFFKIVGGGELGGALRHSP